MCEVITQATRQALSRRKLIGASGMATLAGIAGAQPSFAGTPGPKGHGKGPKKVNDRTKLVLLGTSAGNVWWPGTDRKGMGSAVVVDGDVYLVDFGEGSSHRFKEAALVPDSMQHPGGMWGEELIRAMFITHLHSDHIADYFTYFLFGWTDGLRNRTTTEPIHVYGPGQRVDEMGEIVMEPVFLRPGETEGSVQVPVENPENPVPGTVDTTEYLYQAFALDINDRMRDNRYKSLREYFNVHDIEIPKGFGYHPNDNHTPTIEPWKVYEDDKVKVTATLVDHFPIAPAFGFRFDTDDGSIVFSGDTAPSKNLIRLAQGADILVHEVITQQWVDVLLPPSENPADQGLRRHLLESHTLPEQAGQVAHAAGVDTLVFSHIAPGFAPDHDLMPAKNHFSGKVVVGQDLMEFGVGKKSGRRR